MQKPLTIGKIQLDELDDEQLERFAMDLAKDFKLGRYAGRESVFRHRMKKIRTEWDRRDDNKGA